MRISILESVELLRPQLRKSSPQGRAVNRLAGAACELESAILFLAEAGIRGDLTGVKSYGRKAARLVGGADGEARFMRGAEWATAMESRRSERTGAQDASAGSRA